MGYHSIALSRSDRGPGFDLQHDPFTHREEEKGNRVQGPELCAAAFLAQLATGTEESNIGIGTGILVT